MRRLVPAILAVAVLAACQPAPATDDAASRAAMTPEAAVSAVRQVFQQYAADWNTGDIEAVLAVLAEDVVQMPPNMVFVGKDTLSALWQQHMDENTDVWEPTIDDIQAAGDLVFVRGHFTETATPKAGGETDTMMGQGVWVFQRDATGAWKLMLEQWFDTGLEQ